MADPHVAFGSGFSALGAGKLNQIDNELMEAPEDEDDFDVLNEETFGDIGDTEFDWEKQHERFAEELEAHSFNDSKQNGNRTRDSGFDTAEKSYRLQEEIMEQSINHLVLDEEEERHLVDPAIVNVSGSAAIPFSSHKETNLDKLFGPSSPPAFLDTEHLVSPTSKNIWGSPARDSPFSKPVNNNLQALFDFAKGAGTGSPTQTSSKPSVIQAKPRVSGILPAPQSPIVPSSAQTLAEIENQLLKKKTPTVMTAEELERQMRGESPPNRHPVKRTIATPGSVSTFPDHKSPFSMPVPIQPICRPLGPMMPNLSQPPPGFSPVPVSRSHDGRVSPLHQRSMTPPLGGHSPGQGFMGMSSSPLARSISPTPPQLCGTPIHRTPSPVQARFMSPYNSPAAIYMGNANRSFTSPIIIQRGHRVPMPFCPMGSPGQRFPHHSPMSDPHGMRGPRPGRGGPYHPNNYYHKNPGHPHGQNNNNPNRYFSDNRSRQHHEDFMEQDMDESHEDSYDGLMTQKEKDWIIKIQLMQLQTDNPYLDDYYYTYHTLKKKAKERQKLRENGEFSDDDPKLVIPNLAKVETKAYTPAQFEGSLGRLTTASVHNPRTIIDLSKNVAQSKEDNPQNVSKELRRVRQLLMDIEKGFLLLLDIDDLEKKLLALPEESRMPLVFERREKVDQLFAFLSADDNIETFIQIMSVRKGRKLLSRVLPLLDPAQQCIIVSLMLCNLTQLMRKDQAEEGQIMLTDSVHQALNKSSFEMLATVGEQIHQMQSQGKAITAMLQNKFGSTILCAMLVRMEEIYQNTSPVDIDNQLQTNWCHFVELLVECLSEISDESIVAPLNPSEKLLDHLERLLNKKLVASVEDKLLVILGTKSQS
ncbi:protein PAT1 homolog 1-like isoform X1 [Haliotis cracherodii]|uniref:protein PAT1 homolog 1-like isoform X1 n=1 Tax=Haliotis cracherodii TaxID=6455 RepID=UPI0039EC27A3